MCIPLNTSFSNAFSELPQMLNTSLMITFMCGHRCLTDALLLIIIQINVRPVTVYTVALQSHASTEISEHPSVTQATHRQILKTCR